MSADFGHSEETKILRKDIKTNKVVSKTFRYGSSRYEKQSWRQYWYHYTLFFFLSKLWFYLLIRNTVLVCVQYAYARLYIAKYRPMVLQFQQHVNSYKVKYVYRSNSYRAGKIVCVDFSIFSSFSSALKSFNAMHIYNIWIYLILELYYF